MAYPIRKLPNAATDAYRRDVAAWAAAQAEHARAGRLGALDLPNIAAELEGLNASERNEIESRLRVLLTHLLKTRHQPSRRTRSWLVTIAAQRLDIARMIRRSASLKRFPTECLADAYTDARKLAALETGLSLGRFPEACPFSIEQVLDEAWLPR